MKTNSATGYNLYSTERIYRNETIFTYYFQPNRKIIKTSSPIDIDGERLKINYETGEIRNYKKKEVLSNHNVSVRRTKILLKMLLEMNDFDWFCTLTFDKERIDRTNDEAIYKCYRKYIDNMQHKFPTLRYICVLERHEIKEDEDYGCIHFHLLIGGVSAKALGLVNSGKVCCSWATKKKGIASKEYFEKTKHLHELKETDGETIYNITSFAYGLTTASRIVSPERCKSYVSKYINKDIGYSTDVFKKRFYYSRNLNVPTIVKRLIGADFDNPIDINKLDIVNSPLVKSATRIYKSEYNTFQFKVNNETKDYIDKDLVLLEQNTFVPFENEQLEF